MTKVLIVVAVFVAAVYFAPKIRAFLKAKRSQVVSEAESMKQHVKDKL